MVHKLNIIAIKLVLGHSSKWNFEFSGSNQILEFYWS